MNSISMLSLVLGVLLAAAILTIVILLAKVGRLVHQVAEFQQREKDIRSDARKRSRTVHMASISEQLAPFCLVSATTPKMSSGSEAAVPLTPSSGMGWRREARSRSFFWT
jgi:hypothetical protein